MDRPHLDTIDRRRALEYARYLRRKAAQSGVAMPVGQEPLPVKVPLGFRRDALEVTGREALQLAAETLRSRGLEFRCTRSAGARFVLTWFEP